jgi:formamidopyrimidine-DNA glycosylase
MSQDSSVDAVPELPEVETVRRALHRAMAGDRIRRVETRRQTLRGPIPPDLATRLEGRVVRRVSRRAKYLLVELASGDILVMHLGMSGSFRVVFGRRAGKPGQFHYDRNGDDIHDHIVFEMASGALIVFNDPRRFGSISLVAADRDSLSVLSRLGPEPLSSDFTADVLARALRRRKTNIKSALLDQRMVAGLGNIYVSEALHAAHIRPTRSASSLVKPDGSPRPMLEALVAAIRQVLQKAVQRQTAGDDDGFCVYDRDGQRCRRRHCTGVIRRIVQGGRSTFYCPVCQR